MYIRSKMQPDPMQDYILEDVYGKHHVGRWLVGNTYEGWYIRNEHKIYSQDELQVLYFKPKDKVDTWKRYIPKVVLDLAFLGRSEVADFRNCLEMTPYEFNLLKED